MAFPFAFPWSIKCKINSTNLNPSISSLPAMLAAVLLRLCFLFHFLLSPVRPQQQQQGNNDWNSNGGGNGFSPNNNLQGNGFSPNNNFQGNGFSPNNNLQGFDCSRPGWHPLGISCRWDADCLTGGQQPQANAPQQQSVQCDRGQCCSPTLPPPPPAPAAGGTSNWDGNGRQQPPATVQNGAYVWWDTCENGGYFTGRNCQTSRDCPGGRGIQQKQQQQGGGQAEDRWARYRQICLDGECCTTSGDLDRNNDRNRRDSCLAYGGRQLRQGQAQHCAGPGDCNRLLLGARLARVPPAEQLACVRSQCCLLPRRLPAGFSSWPDVCPNGRGNFLGMFCQGNSEDCRTNSADQQQTNPVAICELNRFCCSLPNPTNDRRRRNNLGCDPRDRPVDGSECNRDTDCYAGEYCGNMRVCCRLISAGGYDPEPVRPPSPDPYFPPASGPRTPAICYNDQESIVPCRSQAECLQTQSCVNGLCCTHTGDEWKYACGGAMAVSNCFRDRLCHDSLSCTSSDFCCECQFGQAAGKCTHVGNGHKMALINRTASASASASDSDYYCRAVRPATRAIPTGIAAPGATEASVPMALASRESVAPDTFAQRGTFAARLKQPIERSQKCPQSLLTDDNTN